MTVWGPRLKSMKTPGILPALTNAECWRASGITFPRKHPRRRSRQYWICWRADGKPLAISLRCHAHGPQKTAAQGLFATKPALHRDPFDRYAGVAEQSSRGLDPNQLDGPRRGLASIGAVVTDEAALAHPGLQGQG